MIAFILDWIDLVWLPVAFFCVHKPHRWLAVGFVLSCMFMLRMQFELTQSLGFGKEGIPGLMDSNPYYRGLIVYSIFIALFIALSMWSKGATKTIYMAASITVFFAAFVVSTIIMAL